jgi:uncharacterized protein YgiM (DUF1202 family)
MRLPVIPGGSLALKRHNLYLLHGEIVMKVLIRCFLFFTLAAMLIGAAAAQDGPTEPNAQVKRMSAVLNLREAPAQDGRVIVELPGSTPLIALGRTSNNLWLRVRTLDGAEGWVAPGYVDVTGGLDSLPILNADAAPVQQDIPATAEAPSADARSQTWSISTGSDAVVRAVSLNLRAGPSLSAAILTQIPGGTGVTVTGRTSSNTWLQVQIGEQTGWLAASYLQVNIDLDAMAVIGTAAASSAAAQPGAPTPAGIITNITATARTIFQRGQSLGNRADVFSKIGDSITVDGSMYYPIGRDVYNLGGYGHLQTTIDYFRRTQNSFSTNSLAAGAGWTTSAVLDPAFANPSVCQPGESPLVCEYRTNKPALALIMYGSNDVRFIDPATYAYNLQRIVEISIEMGVIPVLSTFPNVGGFEAGVQQYNGIIRDVARANGVPLWDYASAMSGLPNGGLSGDNLHPSQSPRGYEGAADFTGDNLNYGYVVRNLTAVQVLDALRRQVLAGS